RQDVIPGGGGLDTGSGPWSWPAPHAHRHLGTGHDHAALLSEARPVGLPPAAGAVIPGAPITPAIHLAWPDVSARGCTVIPSSTTGRNGTPAAAGGGTGWTFAVNSTVTDFSRSFSADGSANVPRNNGSPDASSRRGRTGRLRARSSCDWY